MRVFQHWHCVTSPGELPGKDGLPNQAGRQAQDLEETLLCAEGRNSDLLEKSGESLPCVSERSILLPVSVIPGPCCKIQDTFHRVLYV